MSRRACYRWMIWLVACLLAIPAGAAEEPGKGAVPHEVIRVDEYQNFLVNWDHGKFPRLFALIRTPQEYASLFHAAGVQRSRKPYAPPAELFDKQQIVLVACVMAAPEKPDAVFEVDRLEAKDGNLEVHYRRNEEKSEATFDVKSFLALKIPRGDYATIYFFENDKAIGALKVAEGHWVVPAAAVEKSQ